MNSNEEWLKKHYRWAIKRVIEKIV